MTVCLPVSAQSLHSERILHRDKAICSCVCACVRDSSPAILGLLSYASIALGQCLSCRSCRSCRHLQADSAAPQPQKCALASCMPCALLACAASGRIGSPLLNHGTCYVRDKCSETCHRSACATQTWQHLVRAMVNKFITLLHMTGCLIEGSRSSMYFLPGDSVPSAIAAASGYRRLVGQHCTGHLGLRPLQLRASANSVMHDLCPNAAGVQALASSVSLPRSARAGPQHTPRPGRCMLGSTLHLAEGARAAHNLPLRTQAACHATEAHQQPGPEAQDAVRHACAHSMHQRCLSTAAHDPISDCNRLAPTGHPA